MTCNKCQPFSSAPTGSTSPTHCVCSAGLYSEGSECKSCPLNSQLKVGTTNGTSSSACSCNENYYSELSNNQMTCNKCQASSTSPPGSTSPTHCVCITGLYSEGSECKSCPLNSQLKVGTTSGTLSTACHCNENYYRELSNNQMTCNKCQASGMSSSGQRLHWWTVS